MRQKVSCLLFCLAAAFAMAQAPAEVDHAPYGGVREWVAGIGIPPVPNLPFTGKVIISAGSTLADGTNVQRKTINVVARDSQGRTRNEGRQLVAAGEGSEPRILHVAIYDPPAHTRWMILPPQRVVRVFHVNGIPPANYQPPSPQLPKGVVLSKVELGTQVVEGLELHGTRETRTYPAGLYGNDRSFEVVDEFWYSPDLKVNVIVRHNDPRTGLQTVGLTEITRTEPDAKLFEVPPDYRKIDEGSPNVNSLQAQGITPPRRISGGEPNYTEAARRDKVQGTVVLSVMIGEDGSVRDVSVLRTLRPDLDESSVQAVRQWRFQPAMKDGAAIPFRTQVETSFRLY